MPTPSDRSAVPATDDAPDAPPGRMRLWVGALAAALPLLLGLQGWVTTGELVGLLAREQAAALDTAHQGTDPARWPQRAQALLTHAVTAGGGEGIEHRYLTDADGALVATTPTEAAVPAVSATAALPGGGRLTVTRSLRPALAQAGAAGVLAALVAGMALRAGRRRPTPGARDRAAPGSATFAIDAYLRQLLDQTPSGVLVYDAEGRVLRSNPVACRMLGLTAAQLAGQGVAQCLGLSPDEAFRAGIAETQARVGLTGRSFPCEVVLTPLPRRGERLFWSATLRDLTDRRQTEERLQRLANFDPLTGLPNRTLFRDRLRQAIARASRLGRPMALMFLDLDRFKNVNDSLGHEAGDQLLKHVAAAIGAALRASDSVGRDGDDQAITVARLGGDEFTIIAERLRSAQDALRIAERVQRALQAPVRVGKHEIVVSTSIGITVYPDDPSPPDDLLRHADQAMYRAKDLGRDQVQFYSAEMNDQAQRRLQLEAELRHALERQEFELVWQPKADLSTGRISGVEALLRWKRDGKPVATPDVFIQVLEETGLILPVGRWVLEQAAHQICAWKRAGLPWLRVAVNLSARQLRQGDLVQTVSEVLESTGLPSAQLELELTESMLMGGEHHAQLLYRLSSLGVQLAIDDFGTGWSSLSYLKRFNVDTLKIDRSFVRDTPHDPEDNAITAAVIALARSLKLRVVAEGVETPAQRQFLLDNGCDEIQGWLLSRPLSASAFETWWRQRLLLESGVVVEHTTLP